MSEASDVAQAIAFVDSFNSILWFIAPLLVVCVILRLIGFLIEHYEPAMGFIAASFIFTVGFSFFLWQFLENGSAQPKNILGNGNYMNLFFTIFFGLMLLHARSRKKQLN